MSNAEKEQRGLDEILQSTSDALFPAELGERRVELNSKDCDGDTPLHVLVWRKDRYAVDLLVQSGADINAVGDMGTTPLHVAISQEDEPIIEALLMAGARTNIRSDFNETAQEKAEKLRGSIEALVKRYAST